MFFDCSLLFKITHKYMKNNELKNVDNLDIHFMWYHDFRKTYHNDRVRKVLRNFSNYILIERKATFTTGVLPMTLLTCLCVIKDSNLQNCWMLYRYTQPFMGPFKKYVTVLGGGGLAKMMTKCDIGGGGLMSLLRKYSV